MRIARYKNGAQERLADVDGEELVDLADAMGGQTRDAPPAPIDDMTAFIAAGDAAVELARRLVAEHPSGSPVRNRIDGRHRQARSAHSAGVGARACLRLLDHER